MAASAVYGWLLMAKATVAATTLVVTRSDTGKDDDDDEDADAASGDEDREMDDIREVTAQFRLLRRSWKLAPETRKRKSYQAILSDPDSEEVMTQGTASRAEAVTESAAQDDNPRDDASAGTAGTSPTTGRPRTMTSTAEIGNTISHPGSVKINVTGAFIVESGDPGTPAGTVGNNNNNNGQSAGGYYETNDIRLPNHTAVVSHIAVDIGGSLAKLVYFSREAHSTGPGGRLNFQSFETDRIDECIEFMRHLKDNQLALNGSKPGELCVMATGGGAFKFYDRIRERLGVDVLREDEMECLIIGLDFFITEIPREVFTYSETDPMHFASPNANIYPYMLVNIGSGVSILRVSGPRTYERVGGTSLGGGTLWGLLSLLTGAQSFDDMLDMAAKGDNAKVDMLVGDIYGADYGKIGLKSTTIASSFGKVFRMKLEAEHEAENSGAGISTIGSPTPASDVPVSSSSQPQQQRQQLLPSSHPPSGAATGCGCTGSSTSQNNLKDRFSDADVSRSLLYAISNNIGQIAYLQSQIHGLSNIYFGGSFIRGHPQTMNTLSYAIKFWSKGQKQAYFLRHEGYLGAVGAFLKRQPRNWGRRASFESAPETRLRGRRGVDGDDDAVA
ncbi:hypothetical protein DL762_003781 [Monosporascus cannonballus]|uniref:Pantothenate kinase n=1 Tax=Monosporascus cannonballus TaxID=155416 RepID=A0ABY0HAW9_9PEZI|nr:hypothetical protein DL762_003781 [Monosporascus cannonballus]RYO96291.1 hypothetical protein DL763_003264 [Monosporascus cannonballus]